MNESPLPVVYEDRVRHLRVQQPHLVAQVRFAPATEGGRSGPVPNGFGCICMVSDSQREGNEARLLFKQDWVPQAVPVTAEFFFLGGENAAARYCSARKFLLWDGHFIGEATLI